MESSRSGGGETWLALSTRSIDRGVVFQGIPMKQLYAWVFVSAALVAPAGQSLGQEKIFRRTVEIEVPARGLLGAAPKREKTFFFVLPSAYDVKRDGPDQGARVSGSNLGGLSETRREFSAVDRGVQFDWALKNGHVTPITGRKAVIDFELTGVRQHKMSLSNKYKDLRKRFIDRFFFQGLVAESVDASVTGNKVKFADQTIYMGQALMVLGTEMAILRDIGDSTDEAKARIREILAAVDRLDLAAEQRFGAQGKLDGFFLRDDVEGPNDPRLGGRFAQCESDFQFPEKENASPSGDQVLGLMFGLRAVVLHSGDPALEADARAISSRLYDYARRNQFVLALPNGQPTRRGSDMRWLASLVHGLNQTTTGQDLFQQSEIRLFGQSVSLNPIATFWDDPATPSAVEKLTGQTLKLPNTDLDVELNSFAVHLLLSALAPGDVWSQNELESVAAKASHQLSTLVYCSVHGDRLPTQFQHADVSAILEACPPTGPRASLDRDLGWHKDNRWIRSLDLDKPSVGAEEYNGLDWLILYNLDQLVYFGP